ncbi:MAG: molybdopterin-dependent oxidoreductase [Candidatus Eisenbacteria bacterium]|nr:molybdopterin-dependent oxidoreductase [Candidatus Eisenbacteria bacterium]
MALVRITLNGQEVQVDEGATILEAANANGIEIPTLCHDQQLEPYASCWVCAVKLEGMKRYVPSCGTKVVPGMKVWTDTDDVIAVRRMALELLLSNHRGDCVAPCKAACPAGVDVQGYIALIAQRQYREATKLVKEVNPFPLTIGRVCTRPCEGECRRNAIDGPVGIDYLKRFAADWDIEHEDPWSPAVKPSSGRRVACVGAGPGSLTCAYYLAQEGHEVTVFEALPDPGGMLQYGIPEYRLPKNTLQREIELILSLGVTLERGKALGRDFTIDDLKSQGFDAVFLGMGAMGSRRMKVPGEDLEGVLAGTEFLKKMGLGEKVEIGRRVAVIGGGNTAIDAARTSLRLGAEQVTIVYRRSRAEMPAWDVEVEAAAHEGVEMHFLASPTAIEGDGKCEKLTCIRMELGEPDASGRRRPVPVEGSEFTIEVDNVIAAIGQVADLSAIHDTAEKNPDSAEAKLELTRWGTFVADETTGRTSVDGVFAGGDCVTGAATAIEAIAAGGRAAGAICRVFEGEELGAVEPFFNITKERWDAFPEEELEDYPKKPRQEMPEIEVDERIRTFDEVEQGYTEEQALEEASRCLECGCVGAFTCDLRTYSAEYGADHNRFDGAVTRDEQDERHPWIRIEPEKCILCARCIRICENVQGAAALGLFRRGFDAQMKPSLDRALAETPCESCGQCVASCPTASLSIAVDAPKPGPWDLEPTRTTCTFCGTGCTLALDRVGTRIVCSAPSDMPGANDRNLCVRGRFGFEHLLNGERVACPKVRGERAVAETSLEEAVSETVAGIRKVIEEHGPGSVLVLGSPRLTNEEAFWLQKLARVGLKTPRVGSLALLDESRVYDALAGATGAHASTATYDDLGDSDVILLLDSDIAEEQTVAGIHVRKAVARGARLIVVSETETRMARLADTWIRIAPDRLGGLLAAWVLAGLESGAAPEHVDPAAVKAAVPDGGPAALAEEAGVYADVLTEAGRAFIGGDRPTLVANVLSFDRRSAGEDAAMAVALASTAGCTDRVLFLRMRANGQGITDSGLHPRLLPGQADAADPETLARYAGVMGGDVPAAGAEPFDPVALIEAGSVRAALIVGEDPLVGTDDASRVREAFGKLDTLVVADSIPNVTAGMADVVLPLASFGEVDGSFTNSERRVQRVTAASRPAAAVTALELLAALGREAGLEMGDSDPDAVRRELESALAGGPIADWSLDGDGTVWQSGGRARAGRHVADGPTVVFFHPRWTDAAETTFSLKVEEAGLDPFVVARAGV